MPVVNSIHRKRHTNGDDDMTKLYRVTLSTGEWIADFACLDTAQRFVGSDELLVLGEVFKLVKRKH